MEKDLADFAHTIEMSEVVNDTEFELAQYTGKTHTFGGRDGASYSSDRHLDITLSTPDTAGIGTNPEQLFGAGWSACFIGAMGLAAGKKKVRLPADVAIDAEIDLCNKAGEYFLQARLTISLPGLERKVAQTLVDSAIKICPYTKATSGNIKTEFNLI